MEINQGITVEELFEFCKKQIQIGNGKKHILISKDDEGNGFHTLFCGFTTDKAMIKAYSNMFHDRNNVDEVVLLG